MKHVIKPLIGLAILVGLMVAISELVKTAGFLQIKDTLMLYPVIAVAMFFFYRLASALLPILPADGLTFFAIPVIGLVPAFALDFVASMLGAVIAYYVGRTYGDAALKKLVGKKTTRRLESLNVENRHEIVTLFFARTIYLGLFSSPACYWAGIEKFRIENFLWANLLTTIAKRAPVFLIGETIVSGQFNIWIIVLVLAYSAAMLVWMRRYVHVAE